MGDSFEVVSENLDAHGNTLDQLTERLRSAVDAAHQVTMSDDAYGILCRPFALLLKPTEEKGIGGLNGAVDAMTATAANVHDTAASYQDIDGTNATLFQVGE
ncbi:ESX-1 secretion-associated protein [Solihabitans fulvus]|uniref:ESX-1 secretion-associated protein n=1 Tax=Solihabitans fulvus TaxID=1892852 RepID=A0A5B2W9Y0_9PSEU|nr:type VII secretion target [Solihabitans fulvus]KAA2247668.1 ESX-1 secretion-associated protein [Solihabitans fulvus]